MDHLSGIDKRTAPSWTVPSADGVEIAAYELGGDGPPLLISHATGFLGPMYGPMADGLGGRFRVVALDFRGHGASTRPANDDFGWDRMALDLLAVVDHLETGGRPIAGFGHSLGGGVSLLAERERPGTFSSLFLFEPIVFPDDLELDGPNRMAGPARARRGSFPSRADAFARYAARPPLSEMRPDVLAIYVRDGFVDQPDGSVALACTPDDEARTFESERKVRASTIATVGTTVTVAVGHDEEGPNPAQFGPAIVAALPNARLLVHPELGHLGPFEDPPTVAALVRDHV